MTPHTRALEEPQANLAGTSRSPADGWTGWTSLALLAVAAVVVAVLLDHLGRGRIFFYDEWNVVLERRGALGDALLQPHNGHPSVTVVGLFRVLFEVVGLEHYRPYRLMGIAGHLAVVAAVVVVASRRVGLALAAPLGMVMLCLGAGWQNILWPFQIAWTLSLALGLLAHLLLQRGSRAGDVGAAACLTVTLMSSGLGIPILIGVTVGLLATRGPLARLWVVIVPGIVYGVWYLAYGESQASMANVDTVPEYVATSAAASLAAIGGFDIEWGRIVLGAVGVLLVLAMVRRRGCSPAEAAWLATGLSFWVLTALSRGDRGEPASSRYVYVGVVVVLLVVSEHLPQRAGRLAVGALWVLVLLAAWRMWPAMEDGGEALRTNSTFLSSELFAQELSRDVVADDFRLDMVRAPQIVAGPYFEAIDDLGSPAAPEAQVVQQPPEVLHEVDRVLLEAHGVVPLGPGDSPLAAAPEEVDGFGPGASASCLALGAPSGEVVVESGGLLLDAPDGEDAELRVARYADSFPDTPFLSLTDGAAGEVVLPAIDDGRAWHVQVLGAAGSELCGLAAT
jgi:hypothetical protein